MTGVSGPMTIPAPPKKSAEQLGRIADALFALAKAQRAQNDLAKEQLKVNREALEMQKVNLRVTKQLESAMIMQTAGEAPHGSS